jgi:hypothetical protein
VEFGCLWGGDREALGGRVRRLGFVSGVGVALIQREGQRMVDSEANRRWTARSRLAVPWLLLGERKEKAVLGRAELHCALGAQVHSSP